MTRTRAGLVIALLGSGCGGDGSLAPSGQENIQQIVFVSGARAWINREPDPTALLTSVYYQVAGGEPVDVQTEVADQGGLLLTDEGLYFTDGANLQLWNPSVGGTPVFVLEGYSLPTAPVLDADFVYIATTAPESMRHPDGLLPSVVWAIPRAGGAPVQRVVRDDDITNLDVDDTALYWFEMTEPDGNLSLWSAPKDGTGSVTPLYTLEYLPFVTMFGGPWAASDRLYYVSSRSQDCCPVEIDSLPKSGGTPDLVWAGQTPPGYAFSFDPIHAALYQARDNTTVETIPLDGSSPTTLATCVGLCTSFATAGTGATTEVMWGDDLGIHPTPY